MKLHSLKTIEFLEKLFSELDQKRNSKTRTIVGKDSTHRVLSHIKPCVGISISVEHNKNNNANK